MKKKIDFKNKKTKNKNETKITNTAKNIEAKNTHTKSWLAENEEEKKHCPVHRR